MAAAIITLTTDFGLEDSYSAAMKGVILGINPEANIIDITHHIKSHNILEAAFIIDSVYSYFPPGTIHVVVVDPGVGTKRKAVILQTPSGYFVAPDNGVLSYILKDLAEKSIATQAAAITNPAYIKNHVSNTFHGRDIFAPAAAHISLGIPRSEFGEPLTSLMTFDVPVPQKTAGGALTGEVIHTDAFGNLITDIKESDLPAGRFSVILGNCVIPGLSRSYAEGGDFLALIGSSGRLEIAARNSSAAQKLGLDTGARVEIRAAAGERNL
jgi:S-adenosyl-L-methionine hydrolase (adenosine-forming)